MLKLSKRELHDIKVRIDKGLTLCLPQTISVQQYESIKRQIERYIAKQSKGVK